jgi:hypothetical protein
MDTFLAIIIAVIAVGLIALSILMFVRYRSERRSQELARGFGSEYKRVVEQRGDRREAERELAARRARVQSLHLKDLPPGQRQAFIDSWRLLQEQFVDDPRHTLAEVDELIKKVMEARGYPVLSFEQQANDISVEHPDVVERYRKAHRTLTDNEEVDVTTEELRQAMVLYRELFETLVEGTPART